MAGEQNQRDLVLAPGEYAYVQDETKGQVDIHVGPLVSNLSGTQRTVIFDQRLKRFQRATSLEAGVQPSMVAPEGWYLVVYNPAQGDKVPEAGSRSQVPRFNEGHKVVIPGPVNFVPWPGQMVKRVQGHQLRSNQYLLIRVYDETTAKANVKDVLGALSSKEFKEEDLQILTSDLFVGRTFIIQGTDVNFYIPPTGIEVVKDGEGNFVREAVTLERLEYCVLIDEDGNKRNVRGPDVVFPKPTEIFKMTLTERDGREHKTRKFRAYELTENSGIHLKVIAPYKEGAKEMKEGDELFVTGKEQMIYFPREEQAIIKYEGREIHYSIAIPEGEARYSMDRNSGVITLIKGPIVFLPDPRTQVVVRKVLDLKICEMLYPGNREALMYNASLLGVDLDAVEGSALEAFAINEDQTRGGLIRGGGPIRNRAAAAGVYSASVGDTANSRGLRGAASKDFGGDSFDRKQQYTPPRTITLLTKYDGAVQLNIWPSYAVMLVSKGGNRRVVEGPRVALLEYDENPQILKLSAGTPKTGKNPLRTAYLKINANKVSDVVEVTTKDFVKAQVHLSYRLNFEGDSNKWFDIEDYVAFLTDHMRSFLRNAVMKFSVSEFYGNSVEILRDIVLGVKPEGGSRPGRPFAENGMRIYDLDVLTVKVDGDLDAKLIHAQRAAFEQTLTLQQKEMDLQFSKRVITLDAEHHTLSANAQKAKLDVTAQLLARQLEADLLEVASKAQRLAEDQKIMFAKHTFETTVHDEILQRALKEKEQDLAMTTRNQELVLERFRVEVEGLVRKAGAVSPDLIAALESFGQRQVLEQALKSMAPLSILGGNSVADVVKQLFEGTKLAELARLVPPTNGTTSSAGALKQQQS